MVFILTVQMGRHAPVRTNTSEGEDPEDPETSAGPEEQEDPQYSEDPEDPEDSEEESQIKDQFIKRRRRGSLIIPPDFSSEDAETESQPASNAEENQDTALNSITDP